MSKPADYNMLWAELETLCFLPLATKGKFTVIDHRDLALVGNVSWCIRMCSNGTLPYAAHLNSNGKRVFLHRVLCDGPELVDHKNGNTLDNRRSNLRPATSAQNNWNRRPCGKLGFKGVVRNRRRFRATINIGGKQLSLGTFGEINDAAESYDLAALRLCGEFARLNFPEKKQHYLNQLAVA